MSALIASSSYPLLDVFFTTLWIVGFFIWIWLVIAIFADLFRDHSTNGWVKALWVVLVILLPFFGVLLYLIARGRKMGERAQQEAVAQDQANREYIRSVAGDGRGTADELAKLASLRDRGVISQEEFDRQKSRILTQAA